MGKLVCRCTQRKSVKGYMMAYIRKGCMKGVHGKGCMKGVHGERYNEPKRTY